MKNEKSQILQEQIERLAKLGADYVDARIYQFDSYETLRMFNGVLDESTALLEPGLGVRVLYKGAWGFAATSGKAEIEKCFDRALQNARAASEIVGLPIEMPKEDACSHTYKSPVERKYSDVSFSDKVAFMSDIDEKLKASHVKQRMMQLIFQEMNIYFLNSEGKETSRNLFNVFGKMGIFGIDSDGGSHRRTADLYSNGYGTRGYEMLANPELFANHAERIKKELSETLAAPKLEYGKRSLIMLPGQGFLQVHETIGHPLELDRILGYELSFAGGSFVKLDSFGKLRYGSDKLTVSAGCAYPNSPGTTGCDDEGTEQRTYLLIDKGILVNALSSRSSVCEANRKAGRTIFDASGASARSTSFYRPPIDRMTNVNVLPGNDGTLADIIANTENGIILDTPLSWSIGSNREHFHFGCEYGQIVKDGKITGTVKNTSYQGHTLDFYNSLSAVGNESTLELRQVENCGKGEPNQVLELGHGIPVMKFENVITGERK